jgi:hypothetical protein
VEFCVLSSFTHRNILPAVAVPSFRETIPGKNNPVQISHAKGGLVTQIGFMIQGILLGVFTYNGYRAALQRDKVNHVANMIRSYAVATVVLSFRILHIFFFLLKVPYHDNYAISQWLGLSFNLLLAEWIIALRSGRATTIELKTENYPTITTRDEELKTIN